MEGKTLRQIGYFAWGLAFASLIRVQLPETGWGDLAFGLVLWTGFYPLAQSSQLAMSRYWLMLGVFIPVGMTLRGIAPWIPFKAEIVALLLVVSGVAVLAQWIRGLRSHGH
jgi:hypothetical protein